MSWKEKLQDLGELEEEKRRRKREERRAKELAKKERARTARRIEETEKKFAPLIKRVFREFVKVFPRWKYPKDSPIIEVLGMVLGISATPLLLKT